MFRTRDCGPNSAQHWSPIRGRIDYYSGSHISYKPKSDLIIRFLFQHTWFPTKAEPWPISSDSPLILIRWTFRVIPWNCGTNSLIFSTTTYINRYLIIEFRYILFTLTHCLYHSLTWAPEFLQVPPPPWNLAFKKS